MKLKLYKLSLILILLGIFFIPFNSWEGISAFGEFSRESSFIFFLLVFIVQFIIIYRSKKIYIPIKNPITIILVLIVIWFGLTYFLNIFQIQSYFIKNTSGNNRFIRQYGAFIISSVFFLFTYNNVFIRFNVLKLFKIIRLTLLYSLGVVTVYAILESLILFLNMSFLIPVLYLFDYFPFTEAWLDFENMRVSSVSYEPPFLGIYLMTIAGWMFSYIVTNKGYLYYLPTIIVISLALLSNSRSAFFSIIIQLVFFLIYFIKKKRYHKVLIKAFIALAIISIPFFLVKASDMINYVSNKIESLNINNQDHSVSNKSRFGIMYTSFLIFLENPIDGVGFGQQAFEAESMYPNWATNNNYEFELKYLNDKITSFPPGYNLYTRLLAETGIIGFILFTGLIIILIYVSYKKMFTSNDKAFCYLILFISFIGFSINWLQIDTFRIFGFWICLSLLIILTNGQLKLKKV